MGLIRVGCNKVWSTVRKHLLRGERSYDLGLQSLNRSFVKDLGAFLVRPSDLTPNTSRPKWVQSRWPPESKLGQSRPNKFQKCSILFERRPS